MDTIQKFDTNALYEALDAQRLQRGLSWTGVAKEFWELDAALNKQRLHDNPFSATTITSMKEKQRTSCQHALFMLRWLNLAPECFLEEPPTNARDISLPQVPSGRRLRWSLQGLYAGVNKKRQDEGKTWAEAAAVLKCSPNQLTGLRTAKYATNIDLAMRIVQWTDRRSTDFMYLTAW